MKKFLFLTVVTLVLLSMAGIGFAADYPKLDGSDVLVPEEVIGNIPGFDRDQPVYAACNSNGWFVVKGKVTSSSKERSRMVKEGAYWRAYNMNCRRFHPVQLSEDGQPRWARLENIYDLSEPFIDTSGSGPCLKVCQ
jgi:hypothetical protein